jgi:hypothetical protein
VRRDVDFDGKVGRRVDRQIELGLVCDRREALDVVELVGLEPFPQVFPLKGPRAKALDRDVRLLRKRLQQALEGDMISSLPPS